MYQYACAGLAVVALILNCLDRRMFWLTCLVIASILVPAPMGSAEAFYTFCGLVDLAIGLVAWRFAGKQGLWIADICVLLVISHVMGYALDGGLPFSPYHLIVKILEASQLLVCVVLSPVIAPALRNRDASTPT
jgi:hypothetical protein